MNIKIFTADRFAELKAPWEALQNGADMTAFQRYDWYTFLNRQYTEGCFSKSEKAIYVLACDGDTPCMIAPLHLKKHGVEFKGNGAAPGAYILGEWGYTDYLNWIYDTFDPAVFEEIVAYIRTQLKQPCLYLHQLRTNTALSDYLRAKDPQTLLGESVCVSVYRTEETYEPWLKSLRKSVRQNLRTAVNRTTRNGIALSIDIRSNLTEEEAAEFFAVYLRRSASKNRVQASASLKEKAILYLNQRYNNALKERLKTYNYMTDAMVHGQNNVIICIYANDQKIGFIYGLQDKNNSIRVMTVCFDEEFAWYSPGMFALNTAIEQFYAEDKFTEIDLTRGTEQYKYDLNGQEHTVSSYKMKL